MNLNKISFFGWAQSDFPPPPRLTSMIHACPCWDAECPSQPELHDGRTPPKRFKVAIFAAKVPHIGLRVCCYHTRVCCVENQASPGGARSLKDGRRDCRLYLLCMQTAKPLILGTLQDRASPSHGSVQSGTPSTENSKKHQRSREHCAQAALDSERIQRECLQCPARSMALCC